MESEADCFDTGNESDETFCEEAEIEIDRMLQEIEENIRSHLQQKVFMTKPQIKDYKQFLSNNGTHLDDIKQILARKYLAQLEKIEEIIAAFEKKWYMSQKSSVTDDQADFPCSLLTNQDFVSQEVQTEEKSQNVQATATETNEVVMATAIEADTEIIQSTETQDDARDERQKHEDELRETVRLIREFKINLLTDMANTQLDSTTLGLDNTTTNLVADEFKLSPRADNKNSEILFQIQKQAQKWDMFNDTFDE